MLKSYNRSIISVSIPVVHIVNCKSYSRSQHFSDRILVEFQTLLVGILEAQHSANTLQGSSFVISKRVGYFPFSDVRSSSSIFALYSVFTLESWSINKSRAPLRLAPSRLALLRLVPLRLVPLRLAPLRLALISTAASRLASSNLASLNLAASRLAFIRLAPLRLAPLSLAASRSAPWRLAPWRLAPLRLAFSRLASLRLAPLRLAS